ncbi:hypothetical protein [Pseudomonas syringae]|uniref:hypothetical protein n=1 Tax=Pseudomonas syringae TaxID=317 RepID=UPI003C12C230
MDERRNKHRYNLRANTKWGDFLKDNAANIHFKDLTVEHISESKLRQSFLTQPEVQIAAIREVYEDTIGELMRRLEMQKDIDVQREAGRPMRALALKQLRELDAEIDVTKMHADQFESFNMDRWSAIPEDSVIGRCWTTSTISRRPTAERVCASRAKVHRSCSATCRHSRAAYRRGRRYRWSMPSRRSTASTYMTRKVTTMACSPPPARRGGGHGAAGGAVFTGAHGRGADSKADNKKIMTATGAWTPRYTQPMLSTGDFAPEIAMST